MLNVVQVFIVSHGMAAAPETIEVGDPFPLLIMKPRPAGYTRCEDDELAAVQVESTRTTQNSFYRRSCYCRAGRVGLVMRIVAYVGFAPVIGHRSTC